MPFHLSCIVEGQGEIEAVPILVRRIVAAVTPEVALRIPHPIRVPRSRLVRRGELERAVELAARQVRHLGPEGGILILLDSDDDCPAELGPSLLARTRSVRADMPLSIALAKREFESWFLAAAGSLPGEMMPPADPEAIRGAKEWLSAHLDGGYTATLDQSRFAATFDLDQARRSPSFDRFRREVCRLLGLE